MLIPKDEDITDNMNEYQNVSIMTEKIKTIVTSIPVLKNAIEDFDARITETQKELHDTLHEAGSCPTCEREVQ